MKRREAVAALVVGSMIVLAVMAVFAIELADTQSKSRHDIEAQAHQRAVLVSGLIDAVFGEASQPSPQLIAEYGTPVVSARILQHNRGANDYVALLDSDGRVLAHSIGFTAPAKADLSGPGAVSRVEHGEPWALGNVLPYGKHGVIEFAIRLHTRVGERILVDGFAPQVISAFTTGELRKVPGVQGAHQLLIDGNGVVIGSTNPLRQAGYVFHTPAQLQVLSHGAGIVKGRYFDQVPLTNTTWKIVLSVPQAEFFASVSGARHWLPWLIFAAFALVGIVAVILARRALRDSERVAETNAQLTRANDQLAEAKASLEATNTALAQSNHALEITNAELERRARELARSNAELNQFASIASHDLQEPLRKVRTFTERISETEAERLSERGADYLRRANASAERMQNLIEDLLKFSRVATQGRPFAPVDLAQVTDEILEDLVDQVQRSGAIVHVGELPTVNADPPQMRQLMQNLISNAIKFRREGVTAEIDISATVQEGVMTLVLRDNGIGFEPKYNRRIFRVFERLHGRGAYAGTGIGLALCRKIAERHGGTVVADSVPNQGSTFTVTMQTQRTEAVSHVPPADEAELAHATTEEPYVPA